MKSIERQRARELRGSEGLSVKEIAARLGVSPSSVSLWVRDVELSSEQRAALRAKDPAHSARVRGAGGAAGRRRAERLAAQAHGRALAKQGDPLHLEGAMLFWAEGSKKRNSVVLTNSDADLLAVFVRFLRTSYDVPAERLALSVNCFLHHDSSLEAIEAWWLDRLALPSACLRKASVNQVPSSSKRLKGNVLPYGTARVSLHSTRVAQSIYGAIQEYAGIERPEWLDL